MYLEKISKLTNLNYKTKDILSILTATYIFKRISYKQTNKQKLKSRKHIKLKTILFLYHNKLFSKLVVLDIFN